jgi:hypothetical protein
MTFDQGERKKLRILGVLMAVGLLVVVVQVVRKKGPATAMASCGGMVAPTLDLSAVLREMQAGLAPSGTSAASGTALFGNIDEALDIFAGGTKTMPVPLDRLRADVFGMPQQFLAPPPPPIEEVKSEPASLGATAESPQADPIADEFATLRLMTCLVSQRNQAAIINGTVIHRGETIGSFVVVEITPGQVLLDHQGTRYTLKLR